MLGTIGRAETHPDVRGSVAVHDDETRASSGLPLA
jgi:hypothetical protein